MRAIWCSWGWKAVRGGLCAVFGLILGCCRSAEAQEPRRPNVIFIIIDTLRADRLSSYGYQRRTTPEIDRLAEHSTVFTRAYSQAPCTRPSAWNIFSGKLNAAMPANDQDYLIAEFFKELGYSTAAFTAHEIFQGNKSNLNQGFDYFDGRIRHWRHKRSMKRAAAVVASAEGWLERRSDRSKPFFMLLYFYDPHDPYEPPLSYQGRFAQLDDYRKFDTVWYTSGWGRIGPNGNRVEIEHHKEFLNRAYDDEIFYVDEQLGKFFRKLNSEQLFDQSLVVLSSDHGEQLGETARWSHCLSLSRAELHVPLLLKLPGQAQRRTVSTAAQTIDIFPTLVQMFGGNRKLDGRSLLRHTRTERRGPAAAAAKPEMAVAVWKDEIIVIGEQFALLQKKQRESILNAKTFEPWRGSVPATEIDALRRYRDSQLGRGALNDEYQREVLEELRSLGYVR